MKSLLRRAALVSLFAAVALAALPRVGRAAPGVLGSSLLGVAPDQQSALEVLGRSDQDGLTLAHYGYVTHLFGLPDSSLFSSPTARTEVTARFTFAATTRINARHELGNLILTAAEGTMTVYLRERPGADFNNPTSFSAGTPVATFSVRYHNILNVQAPNQGIVSATADLAQLSGSQFVLDGRRRRLGLPGLRARLTVTGQGVRTQAEPLKAFFIIGGSIVVTDR